MIKISIIIPLYNVNKIFLEECLESVYNQNYKNFEVIVIDDGSSIDYSDIFNKYKNIKKYKTKNYGVSHARNIGLKKSSGDYVMFLDSDDYLCPNALSTLYDRISSYDDQIVLSRNCIVEYEVKYNKYGYTSSRYIKNKEKLYKAILVNDDEYYSCVDTVWAKLYKKDFLQKNNIKFNENFCSFEDVLFNFECYYNAQSIYYINEVTYCYRVNSFSMCHSFQDNLLDVSFGYLYELNIFFVNNKIKDDYFSVHVFRTVVRLFRKYFIYLVDSPRLDSELQFLLNNDLVQEKILDIKVEQLDLYKKILLDLLITKNKDGLNNFVCDVCVKGLLTR